MRLLPRDPGNCPCARPSVMFAVVGIVCGALSSFSASARADDVQGRNDPIAELRSYIQLGVAAQPAAESIINQASTGVARDDFDGDGYAALRAFSQRIGAGPLPSIKGQPKFAADNLFDALRDLGQGAPPNAPPPAAGPPRATTTKAPPVFEATYVGSKVCLGCHSAWADAFGYTLMGRLQKQGKIECETCHGPGSAHAKAGGGRGVGGIISYRQNDLSRTAEENNAVCLGCHERGGRAYWEGSVHQVRGLACTNCHTIMKAVSAQSQLKTAFQPDTCFQCHKDRRAQMFRSSHMPMREGKIVCTNCHNPHGSVTESLIKQDSINDNCYSCHAEKRGPFLFEHAPVRENCLNCHDPHGSINEFSLKMSRPRLCFECHSIGHAETTGINSSLTMGRACQNCHQYIHGSNSPAGGALQR
ncbi:MAG: DmsE family decaheme c-type cytochrome [Xanthobacteraceae bacterium]